MTVVYDAEFFAGRRESVLRSARVVVPVLVDLFQPVSVLDVGCGQGEWVEVFQAAGVDDIIGLDISPPPVGPRDVGPWVQHDLTEPLGNLGSFDLVLCLETGEHLPEAAADTLVDSIARHANHYVVFGAAVPGQAGKGHINCQTPEWWHRKFASYGFTAQDIVRDRIRHPDVSPWYRDNTWALVR